MAGLMEDLDERLETRGLKEGSHRIAIGHWQAFRRWFEVTAGEWRQAISDCTLKWQDIGTTRTPGVRGDC